ncbi:hypothetical protein D3P09_15060 [Paenibacillus pinisoli]|uniref:Uncharacterized protein n=1 Tax=Paenibacillus pinisoli TaxID=1276110 RepID=A0A3A6PE05_9BACL|nr:hypothetical protein [Paenibacillus pinisoli]RJX38845.1 hypothetical protein D3P09_15060 [Paenibacillus pinisoli]
MDNSPFYLSFLYNMAAPAASALKLVCGERAANVIAALLRRDAKEGNKKENTYLSRSNHHGIPLAE